MIKQIFFIFIGSFVFSAASFNKMHAYHLFRSNNSRINSYFSGFNKDDVVVDCHTGSDETTDIPVSDAYPATVSVKYQNIYPKEDPAGGTRDFHVFVAANYQLQVPLPSTQQYNETSPNRFTAEVAFEW